jgi:thiamine biosynthesis lipoprotein
LAAVPMHRGPWLDPEPPDVVAPAGMSRERFPAMGTVVSLVTPRDAAPAATAAVRALFAHWEQTLSRFLPDSELAELNRSAGHDVTVSALMFGVVFAAVDAARATGGLFDPTLLLNMHRLGYDRSFETLPAGVPLSLRRPGPGGAWRWIKLDPQGSRITLPRGVGLDLGGIAKGMAVDAALAMLAGIGLDVALVNAGGDLAVLGEPECGGTWPISIALPNDRVTVPLRRGAAATSGIGNRRWRQGRRARHHLLDPRHGLPVDNELWSVTVVAERCMQAEGAAKAAFVLGPVEGERFIRAHGLAALFVDRTGRCQAAGAWPAATLEALA